MKYTKNKLGIKLVFLYTITAYFIFQLRLHSKHFSLRWTFSDLRLKCAHATLHVRCPSEYPFLIKKSWKGLTLFRKVINLEILWVILFCYKFLREFSCADVARCAHMLTAAALLTSTASCQMTCLLHTLRWWRKSVGNKLLCRVSFCSGWSRVKIRLYPCTP